MMTWVISVVWAALFFLPIGVSPLPQEVSSSGRQIGQAGSPEESQAWSKVVEARDIRAKVQMANEYLEEFPHGGFTPYAHQILAIQYRLTHNVEKFLEHSELALKDLPADPLLLSSLAAEYAEQQRADEAIAKGKKALEILSEASEDTSQAHLQERRDRVRFASDAHFGIGTGYLLKAYTSRGDPNLMALAMEHLLESITLDPLNGLAHFRLAFAYQMKEEPQEAVLEYARAVASLGSLSQSVRPFLEESYRSLHGSTQGMEKLIEEQRAYLEQQSQQLP